MSNPKVGILHFGPCTFAFPKALQFLIQLLSVCSRVHYSWKDLTRKMKLLGIFVSLQFVLVSIAGIRTGKHHVLSKDATKVKDLLTLTKNQKTTREKSKLNTKRLIFKINNLKKQVSSQEKQR